MPYDENDVKVATWHGLFYGTIGGFLIGFIFGVLFLTYELR